MVAETLAVSEIEVPAERPESTLTLMEKFAVVLAASEESEQVIVPVAFAAGVLQDQPDGNVIELKVKSAGLAGIGKLRVTPFEAFGPLFVTLTL